MKIFPVLTILCTACIISSCNNTNSESNTTTVGKNEAGIVIATDTIPVAEDKLNNSTFSVTILSTDSAGTYDVEAAWGNYFAQSTIKMPEGGEHYKPILKADSSYSYTIGFHFDNDTIFHEYYNISAQRGQIAMKYIKAYVMQ